MSRERLLTLKETLEKTSLSRSELWRREKDGRFPPRRRLGASRVGYLASEIEAYLRSLPPVDPEAAALWGEKSSRRREVSES